MHLHAIACRVFGRELSAVVSRSPNSVEISWLPQGLHDTPQLLRSEIARCIEAAGRTDGPLASKHRPDAILLCYGLCSNGVTDLCAGEIPLIVPRTDDCIALFLGSQERYLSLFSAYPGTYWLNNGWIETAFIPSADMLEQRHQWYIEQYGEDNAAYLVEQDMLWTKQYRHCGYITSSVYDTPAYREIAREVAAQLDWRYEEFDGDIRLIRRLVDGPWDDESFLYCPPHHRIEATYDADKIRAVPCEREEPHA